MPPNDQTLLIMQGDGNLVLYAKGGPALWASNTWGTVANHAIMQGDGNFVVYDANGKPYWSTNTWNHPGSYVVLQDDGNLVVYGPNNNPLWASNTAQASLGAVPVFPITASRDDNFPGSGGYMHTDVAIYASGLINAVTHTWEVTDLRGFRGDVAIVLLDENQLSIYVTPTQRYGVDGRWIGTSDRWDNWSANVPGDILQKAHYLAIIQKWDPDVVGDIGRWLQGLGNIAQELGPIITVN